VTRDVLDSLRIPLSALPGFDAVGLRMWLPDTRASVICLEDYGDDRWTVTLADASTADRVARWVADRVGMEIGATAPSWQSPPRESEDVVVWTLLGSTADPHHRRFWLQGFGVARVPALAGLDYTDDRRLPDGSRYVDRLALARVAVHVGGLS